MADYRSQEAAEWRGWYGLAAWRKGIRADRLRADPLCVFCRDVGKVKIANTVDHIVPHRGDPELFWDYENTQSLCKECHDSFKQQIETYGYSLRVGGDGLPTDPNHPFNKPRR